MELPCSQGRYAMKYAGKPMGIARSEKQLMDVASLACRGGWPQSVHMGDRQALRQARDYLEEVCGSDISRVDDVKRNPDVARVILRSYARMVSSQGTISNIVRDVQAGGSSISEKSVRNYLASLRKIFVLEDLSARNQDWPDWAVEGNSLWGFPK